MSSMGKATKLSIRQSKRLQIVTMIITINLLNVCGTIAAK